METRHSWHLIIQNTDIPYLLSDRSGHRWHPLSPLVPAPSSTLCHNLPGDVPDGYS